MPFCDFLRFQVPARKVIFVPQLGRKFRHFSSTLQRYEYFLTLIEFFRVLPNSSELLFENSTYTSAEVQLIYI